MQKENPDRVGLDSVIRRAFSYWKRTLGYQFLFSVINFSILMAVSLHFATEFGIIDAYMNILKSSNGNLQIIEEEIKKLSGTAEAENFTLILLATKIFLFPLEMGLLGIYRKLDLGEKPILSDLLAGYNGFGFFSFVGYFAFWNMVFQLSLPTLVLPIVWVLCTLFVSPMMFFMNQPMFRAIGINLKVLRVYFVPMLICLIVSFIFRFSGFLLFGVGFLLTFPFSTAMIYALYQTIFKEKKV